jgi:RimJ/RimL family protein N-acetyltransferase
MPFAGIRTDRLLLREVRNSDADDLVRRRNDAEVSEYQDWTTPYPRASADEMIAETIALGGPTPDEWYMLTVANADDTTVHGDVVVHLSADGHTAEIGYTLARESWGHGYASDAVAALVEYLFESLGVTRVEGRLHPANTASAMVLERAGMLFEGHTRLSYWLEDENSDDWIYGLIRSDWLAWRDRPRHRPEAIRLVEITPETIHRVAELQTHRTQRRFVSPVLNSFGDALFPEVVGGAPLVPWMRAIDADGDLVGFVMVARTTPAHPEPYLWRLLVDRMHQRRGIGNATLALVVAQCRAWGDRSLLTSWVPGRGSPAPVYLAAGFVPTGNVIDGEIEGRLTFAS